MIPSPKYAIGDVVYKPETSHEPAWVECPDCCGNKTWTAILGTGEEIAIECPTCKRGYDESPGVVQHYECDGRVVMLTIGSVRIDTSTEDPIEYMCEETGIGTGRIHREDGLCATREEAEAELPALVKEYNDRMNENIANRNAKKRDEAGRMAAYYRREIRDAQKTIERAEAQLGAP